MRARVEFSARVLAAAAQFPQELVDKSMQKMEAEKKKGDLHAFVDLTKNLETLWRVLRGMSEKDIPDIRISVTLAAGIPPMSGLRVVANRQQGAVCVLSIEATAEQVKTWHVDWVYWYIKRECDKLRLNALPHHGQVASALLRAMGGEKIQNLAIAAAPSPQELRAAGKPYALTVNKPRREVMLIVADAKYLSQRGMLDGLVNNCAASIKKLSTPEQEYRFLRGELIERLRVAASGPERFGIGLPLVILVGVADNTAPVVPASYPGRDKLQITVDPQSLEAKITNFDLGWYVASDFTPNTQWFDLELARLGVVFGRQDVFTLTIEDAFKNKQDLNGLTVAAGNSGIGSLNPYLHRTYKDNAPAAGGDGVLDIREMQQKTLVKAGQMIAEVRYKQPAVPGKDVFGKPLPPPPNVEFEVTVGEGVEKRENGQFFATVDGIPTIESSAISLSKVFVHQGDVNLRSGNIRFDGNVEITGSIDSGATVDVSGNLVVGGTIRDAFVKVGGDLEARMGIVTGEGGRVHVRNQVVADFVENSNLVCGGDLRIKKVLLNSRVVVGGALHANENGGIVAGGLISCRQFLRTGKLGFPKGATTQVNVGVDWKVELSIRIRAARLEHVVKAVDDDRQSLRELSRRKENQLVQKHRDKMENLKARITKGRVLVEKLGKHLEAARAKLTYDPEAQIFVIDTLYTNCKLTVGGTPVPVTQDVVAVKIISKKVRGTHILALEEEKPSGENPPPPAEEQKAS